MFVITLLDPTQTKSNLLLRWKIKLDRKGVTPVLVFLEASINLEKLHVLAKISSKQKSRSSVPVFFHAESLLKAADFLLSDRIPKGEKILPVFVDFGSIGKDKNGTDFEEQVEILQRKIERNFSAICFLETGKAQTSIERSGNRNWLFHKSSLVVGIEGRGFKVLRKDLPQAEEGELSAESWIPGGLLEGGHSENNLRF